MIYSAIGVLLFFGILIYLRRHTPEEISLKLFPRFHASDHRSMSKGELALVDTNGPALLLALDHPINDRGFCRIPLEVMDQPELILSWDDEQSVDIVSFGSDWVIEARPDPNIRFGDRHRSELPGALTLTRAGPLLTVVARQQGYDDLVSVNLSTNEVDRTIPRGWVALNWMIWASEEERTALHGAPLFACEVLPT